MSHPMDRFEESLVCERSRRFELEEEVEKQNEGYGLIEN